MMSNRSTETTKMLRKGYGRLAENFALGGLEMRK
jgi:hypothetical protein